MDALSLLQNLKTTLTSNASPQFLASGPNLILTMMNLLQHDDEAIQSEVLECFFLIHEQCGRNMIVESKLIPEMVAHLNDLKAGMAESVQSFADEFIDLLLHNKPRSAPAPVTTDTPSIISSSGTPVPKVSRELAASHALGLSSSYVAKRGNNILIFSLLLTGDEPMTSLFVSTSRSASDLRNTIVSIPHTISTAILQSPDSNLCGVLVVTTKSLSEEKMKILETRILECLPIGVEGRLETSVGENGEENEYDGGYLDDLSYNPSFNNNNNNNHTSHYHNNNLSLQSGSTACPPSACAQSPTGAYNNRMASFPSPSRHQQFNDEYNNNGNNGGVNSNSGGEKEGKKEVVVNIGGAAGSSTGIMGTSAFLWNSAGLKNKMQLAKMDNRNYEEERGQKLMEEKRRRKELLEEKQKRKDSNGGQSTLHLKSLLGRKSLLPRMTINQY
eukprot:GDKK01017905.1.p2 GENE.GDKK01017905.1~~GDKK01017905.1.p2  ORF type:complete len:444 (+),score=101.85 GDKK01017905.1:122-1453(+)